MAQGKAFELGRTYGLRVRTMAGMANCSQSHVRRMLLLLRLSGDDAAAIENGAPYTPYLILLRSQSKNPRLKQIESLRERPARLVRWAA